MLINNNEYFHTIQEIKKQKEFEDTLPSIEDLEKRINCFDGEIIVDENGDAENE